ncbi:protein kinase [bacterium]|nr:protein kinase [bacterium]
MLGLLLTLTSRTHLGPYQIIAFIGAGGMGEVYRANDPRLGREVAIKVLPPAFSADTDRLLRFEKEARAASALNHPNILSVYDVGTQDGTPYIVSELLQGETLRHKLQEGHLTQKKAMSFASLIVQGLAAAHQRGIIHRDLKPENIFITRDGHVKILDFGLAKLTRTDDVSSDVGEAVTLARPTKSGIVMGTVLYMCPEQVRGEKLDQRSDIFAFGIILYEMLSGHRPFTGSSNIEIMNAILKTEPDELSDSNKKISPALSRIVQRCMEKDSSQRFQSTRDLAFALENISDSSEAAVLPDSSKRKNLRRKLYLAAALITTIGLLIFGAGYFWHKEPPKRVVHSMILPPPNSEFLGFAISPDGTQLAFSALNENDEAYLWVRPLNSLSAKQLIPDSGTQPFWSPDSKHIGFFSDGKLKKIHISGGPAQTICDARHPRGAAWNKNGMIVFAPSATDPLYVVSSNGGTPKQLTHLDVSQNQMSHRWPFFLPDGDHFLFLATAASEDDNQKASGIFVGSLNSSKTQWIMNNDTFAMYANNSILFEKSGNLHVMQFDPARFTRSNETRIIVQKIFYFAMRRFSNFSVSENGNLVYQSVDWRTRVVLLDRTGNELGEIPELQDVLDVSFSHDPRKIAFARFSNRETQDVDLWIYDSSHKSSSRLTFNPGAYWGPLWSSDDKSVIYGTTKLQYGKHALYRQSVSGASRELLLQNTKHIQPCDWSSDGRFIIYTEEDSKTGFDLWILPLTGDRKPFPFRRTPFNEQTAQFSPDVKWIAFSSDKSGKTEVYVTPFPNSSEAEWLVSSDGGFDPHWKNDGKELYYAWDKLMAVDVKTSSGFDSSIPRMLYRFKKSEDWDISSDGSRFLELRMISNRRPELTLIQNWTIDTNK